MSGDVQLREGRSEAPRSHLGNVRKDDEGSLGLSPKGQGGGGNTQKAKWVPGVEMG